MSIFLEELISLKSLEIQVSNVESGCGSVLTPEHSQFESSHRLFSQSTFILCELLERQT